MRSLVALLSSLMLAEVLFAGEIIKPFVDEQTFVVVRVDISKVKVDALLDTLGRWAPGNEVRAPLQLWFDALAKAEVKEAFAGMSLTDPLGQGFAVMPLAEERLQALQPVLATLPREVKFETHKGLLLIGTPTVLQRLRRGGANGSADLAAAFAATSGATVQVAIMLPPLMRKTLRETMPRLPEELGGGSIATLEQGFRWGAIGIDEPPNGAVRGTIQAHNAESAQALAEFAKHALTALAKSNDLKLVLGNTDRLLSLLTPKAESDRLLVQLKQDELNRLLAPAVGAARLAAQRAQSINNLKQLALGMHLYHDRHSTFPPPASYDANGKPLLSWRVHLLPLFDHDTLYKEFRLDEAWDSPHNKKLIPRLPAILRSPLMRDAKPGMTTYLVPVGKDTIFTGPKGTKITDVTDGTSATILIVEANDANAVIWAKPDDLEIAAPNLLQRLVRPDLAGFVAAYADGSVRFLRDTLDRDTLPALFTRSDGRAVNP